MAKELKSLLARSGRAGRAEHGVERSYEWNLDNYDIKTPDLDDIDGPPDDDDDEDGLVDHLTSRGSHIFDLDQLFSFIESNFCCRSCSSTGETSLVDMSHATAGMATSITFACRCNLLDKRRKKHTKSIVPEMRTGMLETPTTSPSSYCINYKAVTAMQCSGLGFKGGESICGLLGLSNFMTRRAWGEMETIVGEQEYRVTLQVIHENLLKEIALSPRDPNDSNYYDLAGAFDMGWNGRSSGNTYNSLSGQAFIIGARTGLVIAMCVKCKLCAVCALAGKNGVLAREHNCAANHHGSSKSMESQACVEMMVVLAEKGYPLRIIVGDDDSSFKANIYVTATKQR
jgi:hypothetical protein